MARSVTRIRSGQGRVVTAHDHADHYARHHDDRRSRGCHPGERLPASRGACFAGCLRQTGPAGPAGDESWGGSAGLRGSSRFPLGPVVLAGGRGRSRCRVPALRQQGGLGLPGRRFSLGLGEGSGLARRARGSGSSGSARGRARQGRHEDQACPAGRGDRADQGARQDQVHPGGRRAQAGPARRRERVPQGERRAWLIRAGVSFGRREGVPRPERARVLGAFQAARGPRPGTVPPPAAGGGTTGNGTV